MGTITERPSLIQEDSIQKIEFKVVLTNKGEQPASGRIRIKPFVHSSQTALNPYGGSGAVIASSQVDISLGPNQSTETTLRHQLPKLERGVYFRAAIINSDNQIVEDQREAPYDMYAEVMGEITQQWGGLSHRFRTILRKGQTFPSRTMWARFLLADFETGQIHTLPYSPSTPEIEKQWYAVAWADEKDLHGEPIRVDYYSLRHTSTPTSLLAPINSLPS